MVGQQELGARTGTFVNPLGLGCIGMSDFYGSSDEESTVNGKPEYIRQCCEDSLKRLGVKTIDLYYMHRPDPETPIIEETMQALAELVKEGKIRYIDLSTHGVDDIRRAHKIHPITTYQIEYSAWTLDIGTNDILQTTRELGISTVAYSPLDLGFLTCAIKSRIDLKKGDWRLAKHRFSVEFFLKNLELVKQIDTFAQKKGATEAFNV
ncbi:hypothetical protein INT45_011470 [Circinella minor]|uniref:NADP-dependent oxidoreductase domain-containing protein n=1 Tax=Circinella minor TaxID=1195481 RepID=A0A8H7S0F2_9FUNG|nr:hypothetical protein INT45_011470 [Circinella minor]